MSATAGSKSLHGTFSQNKNKSALVVCAFLDAAKCTEYWNKWIVDTEWVAILKDRFVIASDLDLTTSVLNNSLARDKTLKDSLDNLTSNTKGIYRARYRPNKEKGSQQTSSRVTCYFTTRPGDSIKKPKVNTAWYNNIVSSKPKAIMTRNTTIKRNIPVDIVDLVGSPQIKKRREAYIYKSKQAGMPASVAIKIEPNLKAVEIMEESYWESPEAFKLFGLRNEDRNYVSEEDSVLADVHERKEELTCDFGTAIGWKNVLEDLDTDDICSQHDVFVVQNKCRYVAVALSHAMKDMPNRTWKQCCKDAINTLSNVGVDYIKNPETVRLWHQEFRNGSNKYNNPAKHRRDGRPPLPRLLYYNQDLKEALQSFCKSNLNELSAEMLLSYLHSTALPALLDHRRKELEDPGYTTQQLLRDHGLTKLCTATVYRWLERLGFKYEPRRKCYYVDNHEKPETKFYRKKFNRRYLLHELRMHRWIQIESSKVRELQEAGVIQQDTDAYLYQDESGKDMVEYHVDTNPVFQDRMNAETRFGGRVSVRKDPLQKPLISVGQDECIFKQYLFSSKSWTAPDGTKAIVPKDDGLGIMISAFVTREFGFGMELTEEELIRINQRRQARKYQDEAAAFMVTGKTTKVSLTKSPFVQEFEYGVNSAGYWTYEHMVIQMEDCTDVLQTLYPEFDIMFLFDHSCGHDRQRPDGLNPLKMGKYFGGKQPIMRDSIIKSQEFLGPHLPRPLTVGTTQRMFYLPTDMGPFHLSAERKEQNKFDRRTGNVVKKKRNKNELQNLLQQKKVSAKGNAAAIQQLAKNQDIPLEIEIDEIEEGWVGKPKGMMQILWERGFIDETKLTQYTVEGKKDAYGNMIDGTSIRGMMTSQPDFVDEETLLQYHGRLLGVVVDRTPKCHPELAGEGIEYAWGCAKGFYRRLPIKDKRGKEKFRESVRNSLLRQTTLTTIRMRKFSKRARAYIVAYNSIEEQNKERTRNNEQQLQVSAQLIERMAKQFSTHRNARDFDAGFCAAILDGSDGKETEQRATINGGEA